jgi:FkbM family methyltransferase
MLPIDLRPPFYFRVVQKRIAADKRGGYFLARILALLQRRFGILNRCAPFKIDEGETVIMPLYWPNLFKKNRISNYERPQIEAFTRAIERFGEDVSLVDCGADVGLFSRLAIHNSRRIKLVHAFEPNPKSHFILQRNLQNLDIECHAHLAAVSNCEGTATMVQPDYFESDHAKYVELGQGDVRVLSIDGLNLPKNRSLALKIDVEGQELNALQGASKTLRETPHFVVQVEANADVTDRTGIDPCECIRLVKGIRDITIQVVHDKLGVIGETVSLEIPFFNQYPGLKSCDILMISRS